jgi:hypothetical protein
MDWQSPLQVDEGLGRMPENEQRKALESQLKFRKFIMKLVALNEMEQEMSKICIFELKIQM